MNGMQATDDKGPEALRNLKVTTFNVPEHVE